jgi:hypothetical protein
MGNSHQSFGKLRLNFFPMTIDFFQLGKRKKERKKENVGVE